MNELIPHILILTTETSWFQLRSRIHTTILSPQEWSITFDQKICSYVNKDVEQDYGERQVDGILWREGHVVPNDELRNLAIQVRNSGMPCVNHPDVTLKCMDAYGVIEECLDNPVLSQYCKFELFSISELQPRPPCVIKLPDYHGGLGKWIIRDEQELDVVMKTEHEIKWGDTIVARGYLNQEPYISDYAVVEPFVKGADIRVYVYLERPGEEYKLKFLERTAREGEWLANVHTESFRVYDDDNPLIREICEESARILCNPDLFALDLIKAEDDLTILEIHNDVPGLYSMQSSEDYTIHNALLSNLEHLIAASNH